jgi:hypothetical protein
MDRPWSDEEHIRISPEAVAKMLWKAGVPDEVLDPTLSVSWRSELVQPLP